MSSPRNIRSAVGWEEGKERRKWLRVSILRSPLKSSSFILGVAEGNKGDAPRAVSGGSAPQFPASPPPSCPVPHGCVLTPGSRLNGRKEILILGKGWTRPFPPAAPGRGPGPRHHRGGNPGRTRGSVLVRSHGKQGQAGGPLCAPQTRRICREARGVQQRSRSVSPGIGGVPLGAGPGAGWG